MSISTRAVRRTRGGDEQMTTGRYVDRYIAEVDTARKARAAAPDSMPKNWWDDVENTWSVTARMNRDLPAFSRIQFDRAV